VGWWGMGVTGTPEGARSLTTMVSYCPSGYALYAYWGLAWRSRTCSTRGSDLEPLTCFLSSTGPGDVSQGGSEVPGCRLPREEKHPFRRD